MTETNQAKPAPPPSGKSAERTTDGGSIKETIESIIVAFILAFVFRAFVVEAFVIPTGSMAPTLLGKHVEFHCPECGYSFTAGPRDKRTPDHPYPFQGLAGAPGAGPLSVHCPMCRWPFTESTLRTKPGDRILVLKYIYALSEPQRWDVVVFRNPAQPTVNYIKRLVGLPNEHLQIIRGDIFTRPTDPDTGAPTGPWRIQNKPADVQRAVWQPIYHSRFVPLRAREGRWTSPWRCDDAWSAIDHGQAFAYDGRDRGGVLRFAFDANQLESSYTAGDLYPYNDLRREHGRAGRETLVGDLRLATTVVPDEPGGALTLRLGTQLMDIEARVADGEPVLIRLRARQAGDAQAADWFETGSAEAVDLPAGRATGIELWHADHRVQVWVDDEVVAEHAVNVVQWDRELTSPTPRDGPTFSMEGLSQADAPAAEPTVAIEAEGAAMDLTQLQLDRDLYYTAVGLGTGERVATIGPDEFFCLGDNSPQSEDSRKWGAADPFVRMLTLGAHGPRGVRPGFVPRKLMIGRAFFVYFPAPHSLSPTGYPILPNFGDLRFIE